MPYYISNDNPDCSGWAVEKDDGEVIGCHDSKQAAIDQMVAVSIAEDMEPGGERDLPDNYRPATADNVPEGRACGNCRFFNEADVDDEGRAFCRNHARGRRATRNLVHPRFKFRHDRGGRHQPTRWHNHAGKW